MAADDAIGNGAGPICFALAVLLHLGLLQWMQFLPKPVSPGAPHVGTPTVLVILGTQTRAAPALRTIAHATTADAPGVTNVDPSDVTPDVTLDVTPDVTLDMTSGMETPEKDAGQPGDKAVPMAQMSERSAPAQADRAQAGSVQPAVPSPFPLASAVPSSFRPATTLTRRPELLAGAPELLALDSAPLGSLLVPRGHLLLRLSIDRHGKVIAVHRIGSTMPAALADRVALALLQAVYRPGEIDGRPVDSEALFLFDLQPDDDGFADSSTAGIPRVAAQMKADEDRGRR